MTLYHPESMEREATSLGWGLGKVITSATFVSTASPVEGNEALRLEAQFCLLLSPWLCLICLSWLGFVFVPRMASSGTLGSL